MKVKGLGLELDRMKKEHIELVRYWRNHPDISVFMDYNTFITPEMQRKWYSGLDVARDYYFIISFEKKYIGLIHLSDIDWEKSTGQAGLFVWDQKYWQTQVPVLASLNLIHFAFQLLGLNTLWAKVMGNNSAAVAYNSKLGFKPYDESPERYSIYCLQKGDEDYLNLIKKLKSLIEKKPFEFELSRQEYNILHDIPVVQKSLSQLMTAGKLSLKN